MKLSLSGILLVSQAVGPAIATAASGYDAYQHIFSSTSDIPPEKYDFNYPIRKVAVIGAGVGGLIAYRELVQTGFDVHIYERDTVPGGNWHYTDEVAVNTSIPSSPNVAVGDYEPSLPPAGARYPYEEVYHGARADNSLRRRAHRGPKPIWESLSSNAPAPIQQIRELPWPAGTPWELPNKRLQGYIRAFASYHGVNSNDDNPKAHYNTRLERAEKRLDAEGAEVGWTLTLKTLETSADGRTAKATWRKEDFDALVVATGRYNCPSVPRIPGLETWAARFPEYLLHTRQYRRPELVAGENVLIVGAATSGGEISRDIIKHAKNVLVSIRPHNSPVPTFPQSDFLSRIPSNATIIGEIKRFIPPSDGDFKKAQVELTNGTIITGLDRIIFATGYRYTYPFLPNHHNTSLGVEYTEPGRYTVEPIVTDGTHVRALYLDAFYIPDPTLLFINANYGMQSFTYAEFVSLAAAKVWSRTADLPGTSELWRRYQALYTQRKGYGRHFQYLGAQGTKETLRFFQAWLNGAADRYGGRTIDGLSKDIEQVATIWAQARYGTGNNAVINSLPQTINVISNSTEELLSDSEAWAREAIYNDYW